MSIQAVGWALDQELPARPKLVLVSIANHANHTDGYCWLRADTIAAEAACSPRAVFNFIGDLIRNGFIRKAPRRGEDGKQRANDYWILFNRPAAEWIKTARHSDEDEPANLEPEADDPQDAAEPDAPRAHGENEGAAVEIPARAVGPSAPACSHSESAEPSKSKPEDARAGACARDSVPRAYRAPPPEPPKPTGSVVGKNAEQIFVYEGSRAYEAWARVKQRERGISNWHLTTTKVIDGQVRRGWYFPSLFPPSENRSPPDEADFR